MKRALILPTLFLLSGLVLAQERTSFTVRIENVSMGDTLKIMSGSVPVPLAPGNWVLHKDVAPLFSRNEVDRGQGLENNAEDGNPSVLELYLAETMMAGTSGVFNTPVGAEGPGPLLPGGVYEFSFEAAPGYALSFATMFVQSNDWFFAPAESGIALFNGNGDPVSGDVTSQVLLWNAGTEVDEEPGTGSYQAPRQPGPNSGVNEEGVVRLLAGDEAPHLTGPVIRVTITIND